MKNVTTLLLCLLGILTGFAQTFTVDGLEYEVSSTTPNEVTITGGTPATTDLVIPQTVSDGTDTFTVTSVGTNAFREAELTAVTIPTTIVTIGGNSFLNNQLSSLVLPDGITIIGQNAFGNNSIQGNLIIPNSVSSIGRDAFRDNQLQSVAISNAITLIGEGTFESNILTSVTLPTALIEIDVDAFRDNQITTLALPETVTIIRDRAFLNNQIASLVLPDGIVTIGSRSFQNNQIPSLSIPDGITTIENQAFQNNEIASLSLPEGLTTIGGNSFLNNQITNLILPASITDIAARAFESNPLNAINALGSTPASITTGANDTFGTNRLVIDLTIPLGSEAAYEAATWTGFNSINGVVNTGIGTVFTEDNLDYLRTSLSPNEVQIIGGTLASTDLSIPETVSDGTITYAVTSVGFRAFSLAGLTSVDMPSSIRVIANEAFQFNELTSIDLPASLLTIGTRAFLNNELASLTLPEGLTTLGNQAFRGNDLTELNLSANLTEIGVSAFEDNELAVLFIPAGLTTIGAEAFKDNFLEFVIPLGIIPPTIQDESADPFDSRANIELIVPLGTQQAYLDAGWTDFGFIDELDRGDITDGFLFYDIISTAPNEVVLIGGVPPTGVTISVPSTVSNGAEDFTVTSIANNALSNRGLTSVVLPNTLTATGLAAFSGNNLTSVVIPEGISIISKQSFQNNEIGSIELPSTTTKVDNNAFRNNQLTEATLPANVTTIGIQTFENNPITEVTSFNIEPPSIAGSSFSNRNLITLNIPEGTTAAYIAAGWTDFASIEEFEIDIRVAPKVFLQGASLNPIAGEEDLMRDSLRSNGLLPTNSPYGDGASVSPAVFTTTGPDAIVDWVLVELRSGADNENTAVVTSQAAFIQRDGDIVGLDGTSTITFTEDAGDYFIAIRHRNHIGVLAAVPAPLSGAATAVDFTQDITTAKGENLALTTLVNGTFAMIAGDADGSSQILNTDITEGLTLAGGGEDYSNADADMNGFVLNSDIQLLILGNSGTVQQFE